MICTLENKIFWLTTTFVSNDPDAYKKVKCDKFYFCPIFKASFVDDVII